MAPEIPYSRDSKDAWTRYRDALNAYTEGFVNKKRQDSTTISWNEISVLDGRILLNDCELINSLLKRISQGLLNKDQIRISREASMKVVLSDISAILQNRLGQDTWDLNPKERLYINQLYKNITNFEPFNLNSINNEEMSIELEESDNSGIFEHSVPPGEYLLEIEKIGSEEEKNT